MGRVQRSWGTTGGETVRDHRVDCPVSIPPGKELGEFANAFRILQDAGSEWFLDFVIYSGREKVATVVARVRVQEGMLSAIRDRLNASLLVEVPPEQALLSLSPGTEEVN